MADWKYRLYHTIVTLIVLAFSVHMLMTINILWMTIVNILTVVVTLFSLIAIIMVKNKIRKDDKYIYETSNARAKYCIYQELKKYKKDRSNDKVFDRVKNLQNMKKALFVADLQNSKYRFNWVTEKGSMVLMK